MFHSEFDPLPRKTSLRGLTVFVATVVVATAVAVHGFVESTLGPESVRPVVETQVLEPPSWMQEEVVPVHRASTASRRRTTLHTTCPIGASTSISLSSRTLRTTPAEVVPATPPACPSTGAAAGSPAGLSSGLSGS